MSQILYHCPISLPNPLSIYLENHPNYTLLPSSTHSLLPSIPIMDTIMHSKISHPHATSIHPSYITHLIITPFTIPLPPLTIPTHSTSEIPQLQIHLSNYYYYSPYYYSYQN